MKRKSGAVKRREKPRETLFQVVVKKFYSVYWIISDDTLRRRILAFTTSSLFSAFFVLGIVTRAERGLGMQNIIFGLLSLISGFLAAFEDVKVLKFNYWVLIILVVWPLSLYLFVQR
ncbi:MAG TPA: hypothetical protein VHE12_11155 [bacterium]|nr:hypothetical protein [bacterium]